MLLIEISKEQEPTKRGLNKDCKKRIEKDHDMVHDHLRIRNLVNKNNRQKLDAFEI